MGGIAYFFLLVGGGLLIGVVFGWVISEFIKPLDDDMIETALTFILAYGTYFVAENIGVSGVLDDKGPLYIATHLPRGWMMLLLQQSTSPPMTLTTWDLLLHMPFIPPHLK
jgi:NhaP-type Na+/H+ or K+/H+ antiporter